MKRSTLVLLSLLIMGSAFAQTLDGVVSLLPAGVKSVISGDRRQAQQKNVVVAGDNTKGYQAFFTATDDAHGEELWVTDGTPAGTRLVKDINPGVGSSEILWMDRFNDKVVFAANDGDNGSELWISDGTAEGTYMVKNIHEFDSSNPRGFQQVNEKQFIFGAMDYESEMTGNGQWWLWVSDGTEDGTELIYECDTRFPGAENYNWYRPWCRVGRQVFFKADLADGGIGEELWVTDGTREGTRLVKDINTEDNGMGGTRTSSMDNFYNFENKKLAFKAWTPEGGNELWTSDGTEAGTYQVYDQNPGLNPDNGSPYGHSTGDMGYYNGYLYFRGYSPETGEELGRSNLEPGNYSIYDINQNVPSNTNHSFPDLGVAFDGVYMFCSNSGTTADLWDPETGRNCGGELWYFDGENTHIQQDRNPGRLHTWIKELIVVSGSLYYWNESTNPIEDATKLFRVDSKTSTAVRVTDFDPAGDKVHTLRNLGGNLLFATKDEDAKLYSYTYRKPGFNPETDTDDLSIDFGSPSVGIETSKMSTKSVAIYPNPANDRFNFSIEGKVVSVRIFDMSGRLVKEEIQPVSNTVNVNTLKSGIYNVMISTTDANYSSKLSIK